MNLWSMIFLAGIGTYLMRSAGVWVPVRFVPTRWLTYLPLAVILVMAIASFSSLATTLPQTLAAAVAAIAVLLASLKNLPLYICIAIGCVVFGFLSGGSGI